MIPTQKISSKRTQKGNMKIIFVFLFVSILVVGSMGGGGLKMKYYNKKCGSISVEDTVRDIVWSKVAANPAMAAKLLRLHYHDCFVRVSKIHQHFWILFI